MHVVCYIMHGILLHSCSYLSKTYSHALHHVQPDVVVFLGDLLDEGSKASEDEYQSYMQRFSAIFSSAATVFNKLPFAYYEI